MNNTIPAVIDRLDVGYVYAIQFPNGRTKIGRSKNPMQRIRALCTQSGYSIEEAEFFYEETAKHSKVEVACHREVGVVFDRLSGEYFSCSLDDVRPIVMNLLVPYTEADLEEEKRVEGLCEEYLRAITGMAAKEEGDFDLFFHYDIGGSFSLEVADALDCVGGTDSYFELVEIFGCISMTIKTKNYCYEVSPSSGLKHKSIEDMMQLFEIKRKEIADDLGLDEEEVCPPDYFLVDLSTPESIRVWKKRIEEKRLSFKGKSPKTRASLVIPALSLESL